ncbi:Calnexin [Amphibalanus amphitrite]|uniref:Calnexin n=1 Tax=Amphibalanus amphitrite TaxID=1232801 RepID=A0A6A4X6D6_AMPAM|nr:Calnexin [Amphibalanus amphitrite]
MIQSQGVWLDLMLILNVWEADLGLTLAPGSRHLSLSRPLGGPLTGRPLIVQFQLRLPRLRQCAGVQLRLLTDFAADRLDLVNSSTPHSLLFAAESCADQLKLQLGGPGPGRRPLSVDVPPRLAPGQRPHVYRLVAASRSVQLRLDGQRALNVQLWSAGDGLRLDNLIVTAQTAEADRFVPPPPPPPPEPRAEHLRQRSTAESLEWLDWYLDYSAERPWVYALLVLAVGVPACLLLSCCLPESLDLEAQRKKAEALKKKTDEDPDDQQRNSSGHDRLKVAGHRSTQSPIPGQPRRRTLQRD